MNRIILIGNGFDLAHGLKTSYKDFIEWYWREWGKRLLSSFNTTEEDGLCSFRLNKNVKLAGWYYVWHSYYQINPFVPCDGLEIVELAKHDTDLCDFSFKSPFFQTICEEVETRNWVDIEDVYYEFLKKSDNPKQLNDDLEYLKGKLIEYLQSLQENAINPTIKNQILQPIYAEDIAVGSSGQFSKIGMKFPDRKPNRIQLLNFNYTKIADMYMPRSGVFSVNHIHGSLSNPQSVIFGYGDEHDDEYQPLMKKNDNEYLRHIKSFRYLESSNYRKMLEFIELGQYQVCIMGHSCSISDRTLLKTLFEHKNCVSIKPYYRLKEDGTDNYFDLVCSIARNISDPHLMRDRVVRKEHCQPLGQLSPNNQNQ